MYICSEQIYKEEYIIRSMGNRIARTALSWQGAVIFALVVFIRWRWAKLNPIWTLAVSAFLGWALFLV